MTIKQRIHGRWEYPLGNTTVDELFAFYQLNKTCAEDGVQASGIGCSKNVNKNTAILLTYDEESELLLTLKFTGNATVTHSSYINTL